MPPLEEAIRECGGIVPAANDDVGLAFEAHAVFDGQSFYNFLTKIADQALTLAGKAAVAKDDSQI